MTQQELEDLVKQVYFHCENKDPKGIYPAEIDLLEYTSKLIAVLQANESSDVQNKAG
jgi:hypothetical protein